MKLPHNTRKAPEVERATAPALAGRPILSNVHLNAEKGTLEATDSYMAVVIPVEVEEGDESGLIPPNALKAQRKASKRSNASLRVNGDIHLSSPEREQSWVKPTEGQFFPDLELITPDEWSSFRIRLDPEKLLNLAKALGADHTVTLEFALQRGKVEGEGTGFYPSNLRPIRVTSGLENAYGILMPVRIP